MGLQRGESKFKRRYFKYGKINSMLAGLQESYSGDPHPTPTHKKSNKEKGRTVKSNIFAKKRMECRAQMEKLDFVINICSFIHSNTKSKLAQMQPSELTCIRSTWKLTVSISSV